LQATSLRIGQITGGLPNGAWSTTDWVPILIKSSLALGALPSAIGTVSWLPGPAVARIILDVAFSPGGLAEPALNVVHPRPVTWDYIMGIFNEVLVEEGILQSPLPLIRFSEWFELLQALDSSMNNINDVVRRNSWYLFVLFC
jgi:thioester reductase-like protein